MFVNLWLAVAKRDSPFKGLMGFGEVSCEILSSPHIGQIPSWIAPNVITYSDPIPNSFPKSFLITKCSVDEFYVPHLPTLLRHLRGFLFGPLPSSRQQPVDRRQHEESEGR